jgi:hypothetical protein
VFATCLWQACQQVVTMLLFYQVATRLSLTTCWQIVELQDDNKLLEQLVTKVCWAQQPCSTLSTSRWQLVNKLGTSSANTSVDKLLEQHCYKSAAVCYNFSVFTCLHNVGVYRAAAITPFWYCSRTPRNVKCDQAKKKICGFPVSRPYLAFGRRNPDPKLFYWIMLVSVST